MSGRDDATHAYVSRCPEGCVVGLAVDNPDHQADVEEFVTEEKRAGCIVERVPLAEAKAVGWDVECTHVYGAAAAEEAMGGRIVGEVPEGATRLVTIHLPLEMGAAVAVQNAVIGAYPAASAAFLGDEMVMFGEAS